MKSIFTIELAEYWNQMYDFNQLIDHVVMHTGHKLYWGIAFNTDKDLTKH